MVAEKTQLQELHKAIDHVSTSLHEFIDLMFANNHGGAPVTEKSDPVSTKKKAKDPNAPKRNLSSYMLYSQAVRPKVVEENPQLKAVDVAKLVGEMWNKLSDKEKSPYVKEAEKEKIRYEKETANYKTSLGETSSDANTKRKEPSKVSAKTKSKPKEPVAENKESHPEGKESLEPAPKKSKKSKKEKKSDSSATEKKSKKKTF